MTPGGWLVAVSPGMWTSLRRQQWGPQVHFMGIVVKTPSKISRSFKSSGPPVLRAVLPAQNEFRSSMKQSGERAVEGTPTQSSSVKTASVDLARLPSFVMSKLKRSPDFWHLFDRASHRVDWWPVDTSPTRALFKPIHADPKLYSVLEPMLSVPTERSKSTC